MNLINLITLDYPCSLWQVRLANPNVSFREDPTDEELAPFGYVNVLPTPQPEGWNPRTQRLEEASPTINKDGIYRQNWLLRDASPEEIAAWDMSYNQPDWTKFKSNLLSDSAINQVLAQALITYPVAATALAPTLLAAESGRIDDFAVAWRAVLSVSPLPAESLTTLVETAQECHLPQDFVAVLNPFNTGVKG